ncbi:MAG: hypothetical protein JWO77_2125 [Ilumatobacteraceae bacterium]|nr:hypothetical protein [Ilumatobacteraceae bacterium]
MTYTIVQAARRLGYDRGRVYQLIKDGKLRAADGRGEVERDEVDALRRKRLEKFDLVRDLTIDPDLGAADGNFADRALAAEEWLRVTSASRQLMDEALRDIATSRQLLEDLLVSALPDEGRTGQAHR